MRFLPLICSGLLRKPVRTLLIFLQVSVAFALFGILQGMKTGVDEAIAKARADLLQVIPQGGVSMPIAYLDRLRAIPGVKTVTFQDGFRGFFHTPTERVDVSAIDPTNLWLTLAPEVLKMRSKDLNALRKTRTGALISADLVKKYGWHIGDRIPIQSNTLQSNGSRTWFFDVVGIFTDREISDLTEGGYIIANYAYLDEARALNEGTVQSFWIVVSDPMRAAVVSDTIDRFFANSAYWTRTLSLRENAQQQVHSIGDLNFAIRWILSSMLVAVLFSTATMMTQAVRERSAEWAVLKTIGFGEHTVFLLMAAEALLVCVAASLAGLALSWIAFPLAAKYVPGLSMPIAVVELGVIWAVSVALISVGVPGLCAARLKIVDALAGR